MKLFRIRGGVHPDDRKSLSAGKRIEPLPMPKMLYIPLQQHIGAPGEPVVEVGAKVKKGQVLARAKGMISAPIHAPTSGEIKELTEHVVPHPSGLAGRVFVLEPDGADEWGELPPPIADPFSVPSEVIAERVAESGVVGMGGATFPSSVKLNLRSRYKLKTLVINGAECEPYLTCDDRVMQERAAEVLDGIAIMKHALGVPRAIVAIERNKPDAIAAMTEAAKGMTGIEVVGLPTQYPMGSEKHLVQTLTGLETPARGLTADIGVVVHNSATALAVHEAVRFGRPLISRVVTVTGGAIRTTANLQVLVGTPVSALLEHCGGFLSDPARLVLGGPMMGQPLANTQVPMVKGTNGLLALTKEETPHRDAAPCIRCASCVDACPCGLLPLDMAARIRKEELDGAVKIGLSDCISCGSCSYVCPSHIPLVQYFNYAKGKLMANQRDAQKQEETKLLAQRRVLRLEQELQRKKEAMARRKAEMAAKKKASPTKATDEGEDEGDDADDASKPKKAAPKAVAKPKPKAADDSVAATDDQAREKASA